MSLRPCNRVLLLLLFGAIAAIATSGFLGIAPNRLVSASPLRFVEVADWSLAATAAVLAAMLLVLAFVPPGRTICLAVGAFAAILLLLLLYGAGHGASRLMAGARPATRVSLGAGFWIAAFCLAMVLLDALQRLKARTRTGAQLFAAALIVLPVAAMAMSGSFDQLSLIREYAARRSLFLGELLRHALLVLGAVALAIAIGAPLGIVAARRPRAAAPLFATLNLLQTIPSVALFGLLIVPLSALANAFPALRAAGIGGIGAAPAMTALVLYALLPVARNTEAGIAGIDPAITESARAMGLGRAQIFWQVELPLGLPAFLAGLRIVLVQTIGLAAVAALIGAGGLGSFIFQGIGQYATDLVLLGALPIILLALASDWILALASASFTRKRLS